MLSIEAWRFQLDATSALRAFTPRQHQTGTPAPQRTGCLPSSPSSSACRPKPILSRFPAGGVPPLPAVLTAIDTLSSTGAVEHIPLLRSLSDQETILVSMAADVAIAHIEGTHQNVAESDFKLEDALADLVAAELAEESLPEESGP
jgi:hypothetical protein